MPPFGPPVPYRPPFAPGLPNHGRFAPNNPDWALQGSSNRHHRMLQRYLPLFADMIGLRRTSPQSAIRFFVSESGVIEENGGYFGISAAYLQDIYLLIWEIVHESSHNQDVDLNLHKMLVQELDQSRSRVARGTQGGVGQCRRLFITIAEISKQTRSTSLGQIMASFFLANCRHIVDYEHGPKLRLWQKAIHCSCMPASQKRICIDSILKRNYSMLYDQDVRYNPGCGRGQFNDDDDMSVVDWHDRGRWDRRYRQIPRSSTPSPERRLLRPGLRRAASVGDLIRRPLSAPGDRDVAHQARKVMGYAEGLREEARVLKELAVSY